MAPKNKCFKGQGWVGVMKFYSYTAIGCDI